MLRAILKLPTNAPAKAGRASLVADIAVDIAAAAVFLIIDFGLGWAWYVLFAGVSWSGAFAIMVAPFLLTDALKAVAAIVVAREVRKRVPRAAD